MSTAWRPHATLPALVAPDGRLRWRFTAGGDGFVPGITEPTKANTGCQVDKASLTVQTSTLTVTTDDTVVENQWLQAGIVIKANRVVVRNCWINEAPADSSTNKIAVSAYSPAYSGTLVDRCTIVPANPDVLTYGITATNITTHRCYVAEGFTDAVNWQTSTTNTWSQPGGCVSIGDFFSPTVYSSDPHQGNGMSHSDCIQIANGGSHLVYGSKLNAVVGPAAGYNYSHGMVVGPYAAGAIRSLDVLFCWFVGGGAQLSVWPNGKTDKSPYVPNLRAIGNRFDARGVDSDLKGGTYNPHSILVTPATRAAGMFRDNVQIYPCTPASGTAYGASATPAKPVPAFIFETANG